MRSAQIRIGSIVLILGLQIASCGGEGGAETTAAPEETTAAPEETTAAPETTGTSAPIPVESQTLTIAIPSDIQTFNPTKSFFQISNEYNFNVNDQFFNYGTKTGPTGVPTYDPSVIEGRAIDSWTVATDGMSVDVHIREGMTFHRTGNPVTADDLIWLLEAGTNTEGNWNGAIFLTKIDSWEKTGTYDVRITFSEPSAYFFFFFRSQEMTPLDSVDIMAHATDDDPYGFDYIAQVYDVGSGPYMVVNYVPGSELVLEAFPDYWGPKPFFDRVVLKIVTNEADRVLLLREGAIDIATGIGQEAFANLQDVSAVQVLAVPDRNQVEFALNVTKPPFDNISLRQALAYAIPYQEIIDEIYAGKALLSGGVIPVLGQDSDPSTWPYTFDQDKARQLLADGGSPDGFSFVMHYEEGNPTIEQLLVFVQTTLKEVGIDMQLQKDTAAAFATVQGSLTEDGFSREILWYVDDPGYIANWVGNSETPILKTGYANARVDELVVLMQSPATTPEQQQQKTEWAREFQEIFNREVPNIFLGDLSFQIAMRSDITGYKHQADDLLRYALLKRN